MSKFRPLFACLVVILIANYVRADNEIDWSSATVGEMGVISVSGTIALDSCWEAETTVTISVWIDGQTAGVYTGSVCGNNWSGTAGPLSPGTYEILVEVVVLLGTCETETLGTPPKTITVPCE